MAREEGSSNGWRFVREINAGHLVIAITFLLAALGGYYDLKGRVDLHDRRFVEVDDRIKADDARQREILGEIKEALRLVGQRDDEARRGDRETLSRLIRFEERVSAIVETLRQIRGDVAEMRTERRGLPAPREAAPTFRPQ